MTRPAGIARLLRRAGAALRAIEDATYPNGCVFCSQPLGRDAAPVCAACLADLPWIAHSCGRCGSPVPAPLPHDVSCGRCQLAPMAFEAVVAPLQYRFPVDAAIKALKFRRALHYAPALASILASAAVRLPAGIDGLLPVPLHWRRQARRGFNQAAELCLPLQRIFGMPVIEGVKRVRATDSQAGLGRTARQRNLRDAFRVHVRLASRHVLIVDDVLTTGATCGQLAGALRKAGVRRVSVLAVARAVTPD